MKITNQSELDSKITLPDTSKEDINTLSNTTQTENMTTSFLKIKSSAKTFAKPSEDVEQTITLTNNSDLEIKNVSIKDNLSQGATFKEGTVFINNVAKPLLNIITGFTLEDSILSTDEVVIKYTITVDSSPTVEQITNTAQITYDVNEITNLEENTNTITLPLVNNIIVITKTASATAVISGQTLTFQSVIENTGNTTNTNLVFKDPIPQGTTFVSGSVKIDGVSYQDYDPATGFNLSDLEPQGKITVSFDVSVN